MPFNYEEYQAKCNSLSTEQLQKEWENYTRQIAGGATSTATSVLFSPLTAGISLVGLGLSAPRIHNARKKREIIEAGLQARGSTHNTRTRDVAGSMAVSGAIAGLTLGLASPGADIIAGEAVGKGVEYAAAHVILDGAGAAVEHKHDGHLKKKGEQELKMKQMQMQLNQYQGYQQQFVQGQGMQMQSIQGVQMQMGGFQQPGLTPGLQLPQPGILMQNQQQIQWQQQPGLQIPGMQMPGFQQGMQLPPRPHSAAPNNQYQFAPPANGNPAQQYQSPQQQQFTQQAPQQQQQLPQYQQVQQQEKYLVMVPNPQQQQEQTYPSEKTPAYTTNGTIQGDVTPLPLYSEQATAAPVETERAAHPTHIDIPEGPTMEEEIAFLKAKLLRMELEKRGMSATIMSPCEISLDGPDPEPRKPVEKQSTVVVQEVNAPKETPQELHQQHPQLHVETQLAAQPQQPPQQQRRDTLSAPPVPAGRPASPGIPQQQQYVPPPPASPHPQTQQYTPPPAQTQQQAQQQYAQPPTLSTQTQQYAPPPPAQPQQQAQQHQRQNSLAAPPIPAGRPVSPAPPQQQYTPPPAPQQTQYQAPTPPTPQVQNQYQPPPPANYAPPQQQQQQQQQQIYQPQPTAAQHQQQYQPSPITSPQQQYQSPAQIQRQDSGYYSQAPTPLQRPSSVISSISSISSPINRHNSIASYTPGGHPQQSYNPAQQQYNPSQQGYNPQMHGRSQSVVSPMGTPAPPPYFPPPPTGPQPVLAGKDYFNQGAPPAHPSFPNYQQAGVGGQRQSIAGGMQGWQWGAPQQQQGVQMVGGGKMEPNYGAPPPVPGAWRSS